MNNPTVTTEQIKAYIAAVKAIADAIKFLGEVPAGKLYANLMPILSLEQFEKMLERLVEYGFVERTASNLLIWKGEAQS